MGHNICAQLDGESAYVTSAMMMTDIIIERVKKPWLFPDIIFNQTKLGIQHNKCIKIMHDFSGKIIRERSKAAELDMYALTSSKRIAFLDVLLKAKSEDPTFTFDDIQEEVDTFMFEGHDTTAVAASWACHMIGSHPDVQKKLQEEVDGIFKGSDRQVTNDDLRDLKYLECVIKETLRMFPAAPLLGRTLSEDTTIGKFTRKEFEQKN